MLKVFELIELLEAHDKEADIKFANWTTDEPFPFDLVDVDSNVDGDVILFLDLGDEDA